MDNMKLWYLSKRRAARAKGVPPLTFESNGQPVTNWSIAGAQGGVGDRTKNLANVDEMLQGFYAFADGRRSPTNPAWVCTPLLPCEPSTAYTFSYENRSQFYGYVWFNANREYISSDSIRELSDGVEFTAASPANAAYMVVNISDEDYLSGNIKKEDLIDFQIEKGSAATEYEPYGYKIPIVCGSIVSNVYLDEPLRKGDSITGSIEGIRIITNNIMPSAIMQTITQDNITFSCDGKGRYIVSGKNTKSTNVILSAYLTSRFTIPVAVSKGGKGTCNFWNTGDLNSSLSMQFMLNSAVIDSWALYPENRAFTSYETMGNKPCNRIQFVIPPEYEGTFTVSPQFTDDATLPEEYTPYNRDVKTAIAIPTASGMNTLSVGTTVQPSGVSVSAEPDMPTPLERYLFSKFIINNE